MVILDLGKNLEGVMSMNADKVERVNGINGTVKPKLTKDCVHQRMLDDHYNDEGNRTENVVCRECGKVFPDPSKV